MDNKPFIINIQEIELKNKERKQKTKEHLFGLLGVTGLLVLLLILLFVIYTYSFQSNKQSLEEEQKIELDAIEEFTQNYFNDTVNMLLMFNNSDQTRQMLTGVEDSQRVLFNDIFYSTITQRQMINQLRFINISGDEVIRVDREINGNIHVVDKAELQNKSDRYYFTEALSNPSNQVYISKFDLNVEHGEIEIPYKPMIRISKTITGIDNQPLGIIIANIMGEELLSNIDSYNIHEGDNLYFLNAEGYYLHNVYKDKTFNFMFDDRDLGFHNEFPGVWNEIIEGEDSVETNLGNYYIRKLKLISDDVYKANDRYFYIVMNVPLENLNKLNEELLKRLYFSFILVAPLMMIIGWIIGNQSIRNKFYRNQLEDRATKDGLTGLFNHKTIIGMLEKYIALSGRSNEPLTVVFIDLNNLKKANDVHGHDMGDNMIIGAAQSLENSVRTSDSVARLGGDEFLLLLPNCNEENALKIVTRAQEQFKILGSHFIGEEWVMSYGCATYMKDETAGELINRADSIMYEFKKNSKKN